MTNLKISSGQDWTFDKIEAVYEEIDKIARSKYKLDPFPSQIEIISFEQMLDAYCSNGLPIMYPHWSYGEQFIKQLEYYKRGHMNLAYEIVINSNPCIAYLMEENTMCMQALVIAHACFGHSHVYKNNYLFKQWTSPESIIDYLAFAKRYIVQCEEQYGTYEVERVLDVCHALQYYGIDKYRRPSKFSASEEQKRQDERRRFIQSQVNELWSTIPQHTGKGIKDNEERFPKEPQENILYFIEKNAPRLEDWQREIIRIVRKVSQYFYPQMLCKLLHEASATFFHYHIMNDLYDKNILDDGAMQEFLASHTGVINQRDFDDKYFSGFNPYAVGFAIMMDIKRVSMNPTQEDKDWFKGQDWVGGGDWVSSIHYAMENFKDDSFILQFLSPTVIRNFQLFNVHDDDRDPMLEISYIHDEKGYKQIRRNLSRQNNPFEYVFPNIQVVEVDRWGDRTLTLHHTMNNRRPLNTDMAAKTTKYISELWGYPVKLLSIDKDGAIKMEWEESAAGSTLDVFLDDK